MAATTPITSLLPGTVFASSDVLVFVDVSDHTQSPQGSTLKSTLTSFFAGIPVPVVVTSASANALAAGLTGATNPAFAVDASTALQVAGLKVTGAATGGTVAVQVTDSGAATNLSLNAKGTGTIAIGSASTGRVTITPVTTITGLLTLTAGVAGPMAVTSTSANQFTVLYDSTHKLAIDVAASGAVTMTATTSLSVTASLANAFNVNTTTTSAAIVINCTNASSQGGYFVAQQNAVSTSFFGTSGAWLGTTASNTAIASYTGTIQFYTNASGTVGMSLSTANALALLGDFAINTSKFTVAASSGNTVVAGTLGVTGKLSLSAATQALLFTGQTTGEQHAQWQTTGGNLVVGVEASVAGTSYTNSTAYASVIVSGNTRDLQFGSNSAIYHTLCGGALSGITNSSIGNHFFANVSAPTGNPTGGGFFWVESGALKYRGSSGTITTIAPA